MDTAWERDGMPQCLSRKKEVESEPAPDNSYSVGWRQTEAEIVPEAGIAIYKGIPLTADGQR